MEASWNGVLLPVTGDLLRSGAGDLLPVAVRVSTRCVAPAATLGEISDHQEAEATRHGGGEGGGGEGGGGEGGGARWRGGGGGV